MTRTHTIYFSIEQLRALGAAVTELEQDFERRRPYVSKQVQGAMNARLELLRRALDLLLEPVPESMT